ncbi:MAG: sigma-54-dependent transcriptional regulator [Sandaracinaceae bacterium]
MSNDASARILILDDERDAAELLAMAVEAAGHSPTVVTRAAAAIEAVEREAFDAVVTDFQLDDLDGIEVCTRILALRPDLPVIVVTGHATLETAVAAMRAGAHDFVTKPVDVDLLLLTLKRAIRHRRLETEVKRLKDELAIGTGSDASIVGKSSAMRHVFDVIERVAATDATILVTGESGTGKELVARAVHRRSQRAEGPFVAINCAAVPAQLLESELFGHVKGAFTDARNTRKGLFLEASSGTLFLDEIGEMPLEMQVKLLRALQERVVRPVGGNEEVPFDARVIAATNRDLEEEVREGRFREDLFYRINVVGIAVPPLRERPGDIPLLAQHFVERHASRFGKDVRGLAPEALEKLLAYEWPGNVRELENGMERAVALARNENVRADDLPERVRTFRPEHLAVVADEVEQLISVAELERRYIFHVLKLVDGNKSQAARILGLDRRTLYRKLDAFEQQRTGGKGTQKAAAKNGTATKNGTSNGARPAKREDERPPMPALPPQP